MLLQIITEGKETDLLPDTEITLEYENPFLATDHIPAPYSLTYELPLTPRNRMLFGFPDRATSAVKKTSLESRIMFAGVEITSGQQTVEETNDTISVNYNGAVFPDDIRKFLQYHTLGEISLGTLEYNNGTGRRSGLYTYSSRENVAKAYNETLLNWTKETFPDMVAPTIAIRHEEQDFEQSHLTREWFINNYEDPNGYIWGVLGGVGYTRGFTFSKILPAFRIGWLLDHLLEGHVRNNIYNEGELRRCMLLSRWHPAYQVKDDSPVYEIDPATLEVTVKFANFLPSIPGNEFLTEMLKLPCATLFIKGSEYSIELNRDILVRPVVHNWSDKMIGTPTLSLEAGQKYVCGYSEDDGTVPEERVITSVETIQDMYTDSEKTTSEEDLGTYRITTTGQIIEALFDTGSPNVCRYKVLRQQMNRSERKEETEEEDDTQTYDNTFNGKVLKTNLRMRFPPAIGMTSTDPKLKQLYYMPEGEPIDKQRPEELTVGLYMGMCFQVEPNPPFANGKLYPYLSHVNYDAHGNRKGTLSLAFGGEYGLFEHYHREFAAWVEKPKQVLKASFLLTPWDLHNLDLRDKFYIRGRLYFIRTLSVTLQTNAILPAKVELIEV